MASITTPSDGNTATRLEFWRDTVSRSFVPLEIVPREGPDFHAQLRIARVGPVQVSVVTTPPHTARSRRPAGSDASDHVKVSLQLTGHCVLTQGDHQAELRPGELAVYDTRRPYTLDTDRPGRSLALMFPRTMLRIPDRELARVTAVSVSCRAGLGTVVRPFLYGLARQVDELESLGTPRLADNVADLVGTLLAEHMGADRAPRYDDGRQVLARRILAYMEQRLADPELGPDRIAEAHHISRRYLYKLLAEHGYTVSGWIREQRLARCRRDLADPALSHLPVGAIAGRWGFPGPAHFSHAFKTAYGISPSEARAAR
ncbi:helix-turn-helix domain-containing protein [Streptomyces sp. NPDC050988]|uniref:AraC-like ligand-binding domain-containing protein n=1 Tax=Streptomyces sp. NPDC050988 TaxID=3365637 RepID=UPI003788CE56